MTYEKKLEKQLQDFFEKTSDFSELVVSEFIERILEKPFNVQALIVVNKELAGKAIEFVRKQF
ncbi:MAG: hypothetical protein ABH821_04605 [archaeon]